MKYYFLILFVFINSLQSNAQENKRPKIGLTLSGGGAKGLAHIGILKAIDSAGLKIDYITGTSMGAVIGAMYAIGYSGNQIEKIAYKMDWDVMLSNQLSLRSLNMEEKEEYGKYAIELPYINSRLQLPGGLLEGQELWMKLAEFFHPVNGINDFSKFSIPFKCIAADIAKGEAVVLDKGNLATAIRASMAIPSVFTAVDHNGQKLVDGGIVRNFPVRDVRQMGADIAIGSSVTSGLVPKEKLNSAIDILVQLAFFKESEDYASEIPLCNIYISQPLEKYNMGSFSEAADLIKLGIEEGIRRYPALKHLTDSLNEIYGVEPFQLDRLPKADSVFISEVLIQGLDKTSVDFFIHSAGLDLNKLYAQADISKLIRRVFGTRYYNTINYYLEVLPQGKSRIVFVVDENPSTIAKMGVHYNLFSGIGVIANLTSRDFLTPNSRSLVTVNIGENLRLRGEHLQYFGANKNLALIPKFQLESFTVDTYNAFVKSGRYRQFYYVGELKAQYSGFRAFTGGIGSRYEYVRFKPLLEGGLGAKGKNDFFTAFTYLNVNTLNKSLYPKRGFKLNAELGLVFNQRPNISFFSNGVPVTNVDSLGISYENYQRLAVSAEGYIPLSSAFTFFSILQTGINFNYRQNLVNNFQVGGLTKTMRNQVLFAGLDEATISTPSIAAFMLGVNFQFSKNIYFIARSNALVNNFISIDNQIKFDNHVTGHALTFAYNTPIGPLEFSVTYSDQSRNVLTYVNFGIPF